MKCPKCGKELMDGVTFCGYCGASIQQKEEIHEEATPVAELPVEPVAPVVPLEEKTEAIEPPAPLKEAELTAEQPLENPQEQAPKKEVKKKIALKLLIIFSCLAIILGAIGGFLTARGIIDIENIFDFERFSWQDNGYKTEAEEDEEDKKEPSEEEAPIEDEETEQVQDGLVG